MFDVDFKKFFGFGYFHKVLFNISIHFMDQFQTAMRFDEISNTETV